MARKTIADAITAVLTQESPLSAQEIYNRIAAGEHYEFQTKDPFGVIRSQLYKRTEGNDHSCAAKRKLVRKTPDGRFTLIE